MNQIYNYSSLDNLLNLNKIYNYNYNFNNDYYYIY